MEKKPLISIENLRKTYIMGDNEVKALQSASLNIYKNEYVYKNEYICKKYKKYK